MTASTHSKPASTKVILERWEVFNTIAGPYLEPITTPAEYEAADALLNDISDRMSSPNDRQYINLFRLLAARIQAWEDEHEPLPNSAPHELLAFLLEEHRLKQSDLESIVDQSTLSKILRGERGISKRLAFAFSERFGVSVAAFLEMGSVLYLTDSDLSLQRRIVHIHKPTNSHHMPIHPLTERQRFLDPKTHLLAPYS